MHKRSRLGPGFPERNAVIIREVETRNMYMPGHLSVKLNKERLADA